MAVNPKDYWIKPNWPAPSHVQSCTTTRLGGVSKAEYNSLNLGLHVGDDPQAVFENRQIVQQALGYQEAAWLEQTHSTTVAKADSKQVINADASWTDQSNLACVVMTADCLPVLLCDKAGQYVAAVHAGWRGLLNGILEATIDTLPVASKQLMAWLGPAIGPTKFEVGAEVKEAFLAKNQLTEQAFKPSVRQGHFLADIYQLAKMRLMAVGVNDIYGGEFCTMSDEKNFYSYRRQAKTGRIASLIWINK